MPDSIPKLSPLQIREWFANLPRQDFVDQKILLLIPDATVPLPLPPLFDALFHELRPCCTELDVLVALGSHPPMSDRQIAELLGIDETERGRLFYQMHLFNHEWDSSDRLLNLGSLSKAETAEITKGILSLDVSVQINSRIRDYDLILVLGAVFPDQFLGYSGGNEYLFPGIGGPDIINFLENLGGLIKKTEMICKKDSPVRCVIDTAAAMIPKARRAITFVASSDQRIQGLFYGTPETAWNEATDLLDRVVQTR